MPVRVNVFCWLLRWLDCRARLVRRKPAPKSAARRQGTEKASQKAPAAPPRPAGQSCLLPTHCQPLSALRDEPWPATVRTLARDSLKLVLKRRFEPGTVLRLDLENPSQTFSRTFFARVARATVHGGGDWLLDCTVANVCDEDEVVALLS